MQVCTYKATQLMKRFTLWLLHFSIFISNSGYANHSQIGTRKVKEILLGLRCYDRVAKTYKHQAHGEEYHKVNAIGRCNMNSRSDTYCAGKNWRVLSKTF